MRSLLAFSLLLLLSTNVLAQPDLQQVSIELSREATVKHPKAKLRIVLQSDDSAIIQVIGKQGTEIAGLSRKDFLIRSSARGTAEILSCDTITAAKEADLRISFVLDNSASMFHAYDSITKYLDELIIGVHGRFSAVAFDNVARNGQHISTGRGDLFLACALEDTSHEHLESFWHYYDTIRTEFTPLYDAIYEGLSHSDRPQIGSLSNEERIVIVISDGADNASRWSLEDLADLTRKGPTRLFAINFRTEPDLRLQWLAHQLHGEYYYAADLSGVIEALQSIKSGVLRAYKLSYRFPPQSAQGRK